MQNPDGRHSPSRWSGARGIAGTIAAWTAWIAMTACLVAYIWQYSRNVPFMDDFDMVPVLTGSEPATLDWSWSQHHEHRPMVSRLILLALSRFVSNDFRAPRYANIALLASAAAAMLLLVRRLRGSARITDVVLPLSILNLAQAESLLIGFAMNLILTSVLALALIVIAVRGDGRATALGIGMALVMLPLCGGSGLVMLPPLALWLAGYLATGWFSGRKPGPAIRAVGLGLIAISMAVVAFYMIDYSQPPYHRITPSIRTAAIGAMKFLSLSICPIALDYWWPVGPILVAILGATLGLLARAAYRTPGERPRALALIAILLSIVAVAAALGLSRAGIHSTTTIQSRYITLAIPLLSVVYVAWLAYGQARARVAIHAGLLAMICLALPHGYRYARGYGLPVFAAGVRVEGALKNHMPTDVLLSRACPALFPDPVVTLERFRMLKTARIGAFVHFQEEDQLATAPDAARPTRR